MNSCPVITEAGATKGPHLTYITPLDNELIVHCGKRNSTKVLDSERAPIFQKAWDLAGDKDKVTRQALVDNLFN